jgi:serine protease Do
MKWNDHASNTYSCLLKSIKQKISASHFSMKASLHTLPSLLSLVMMAVPALAIEAPEDNAPPPAQTLSQAPSSPPVEAAPHKAFLGIVTEPIPDVLRQHLGPKAPHGILVRSAFPDSPAARAGIAPNDVITHIGPQPIHTPEDLTDCIGNCHPGETIEVSIIHHGAPRPLEITLGERPAHIPMAGGPRPEPPNPQLQLPDTFADRIRKMLESNQGGIEFPFMGDGAAFPDPHIHDAIRELQQRLHRGNASDEGNLPLGDGQGNFSFNQSTTFRMMDEQGSVEVTSANDSKEVTIRDKKNQIVWSGPWNTEQDKAAAPDELRERIERLNIQDGGDGLQLQIVPPSEIR